MGNTVVTDGLLEKQALRWSLMGKVFIKELEPTCEEKKTTEMGLDNPMESFKARMVLQTHPQQPALEYT